MRRVTLHDLLLGMGMADLAYTVQIVLYNFVPGKMRRS